MDLNDRDSSDIRSEHAKALNLLRHIGPMMDYSGSTASIDASLLYSYNSAVQSINEIRCYRPRRSLEDLPVEIWLAIVKEATLPEPYSRNGANLLIILTQVSQTLAKAIFQAPTLWSHIAVDSDVEDLQAVTSLFLTLSGDSVLSLEYEYGSASIYAVAPLLLPHVSRIQTLFMLQGEQIFLGADPFISRVPFPALQRLEIQYPCHSHDLRGILEQPIPNIANFASKTPLLSPGAPFIMYNSTAGYLRVTKGRLTDISVQIERIEQLATIMGIPSLKNVKLTSRGLDFFRYFAPRIEERSHLAPQQSTPLTWETLNCTWVAWDIMDNLTMRCGPSLVALDLRVEMRHITAFMRRFADLPALIRLNLIVEWNMEEGFPILDETRRNMAHHLHTFSLKINEYETSDGYRCVTTKKHPLYTPERCASLGSWFFERAPNLREVEWERFVGHNGLLHQLQHLLVLNLVLLDPPPSFSGDLRSTMLPSLLSLTLDCDPDQMFLLAAPKLRSLTYCNRTSRSYFSHHSSHFQADQWPNLLHLSILLYTSHAKFHGTFMICRLTLRYPAAVASACHQMALHPEIFPVLQELDLMSPPEWDIFCIMLEKRLIARVNGVRGLTRVYVGYAPPDICHFIKAILQGQIIERRSNYELSLARISKSLIDNKISGCTDCHLRLRFCMAPPVGPMTMQEDAPKLPPYPSTVKELLETWEERYMRLRMYHRPYSFGKVLRAMFCHRRGVFEQSFLEEPPEGLPIWSH